MSRLQEEVKAFRAEIEQVFPTPSARDSIAFVITEAAEVLDAMLKSGYSDGDYLRNRPADVDLEGELGDLLLMVATLATALDVDLDKALRRSMAKIRDRVKMKRLREMGVGLADEPEGERNG